MTKRSQAPKHQNRRPPKGATGPAARSAPAAPATKLDQIAALLARRQGATVAEMMSATGWQPHSVRGALAGSLKRRGLVITSEKIDGVRRYRSTAAK